MDGMEMSYYILCRCVNDISGSVLFVLSGTLLYHGTEEQRERWLPGIASGDIRLQAFGVSEPDSGTDTLSLRTTVWEKGASPPSRELLFCS